MSEFSVKNNIYLIGFMGAGKTTVGKVLSRNLNKPFYDLDIEIASFCKSTIKDIFENKGEDFFRKTETLILEKVSHENTNAVISTGGGVVLKEENWHLMNSTGKVVYLMAGIDDLWERVKSNSRRPLLNVDNAFKRAKEILDFRQEFYNKADFTINTADLSVEQTVIKIKDCLEL